MPGGDRTGPMGQGPLTGRGAGYCAQVGSRFCRRGFGGFGRFGAQVGTYQVDEKQTLQNEMDYLEKRLDDIKAILNQE